jgi:hypothetical protein
MRNLSLAIVLSIATAAQAQVVPSFTETFGGGTYDHAAWVPLNSSTSLTLLSSSADRDHWDAANDGGLLVKRAVNATGTYGAMRSLGIVAEKDVGSRVSVDFAYERPADGFRELKPLFIVDGRIIAEGAPVNVFSAGNDPAAANGHFASVLVRAAAVLTRLDVGKELLLSIQFLDGSVAENRELLLDAVNFQNAADAVEPPAVASRLSGSASQPVVELAHDRRIAKHLPALQYIWNRSSDLTPGSWSGVVPLQTAAQPLNADFENVTQQFAAPADAHHFYQLTVRNKRLGDPGVTFDESKMDPAYPQMQQWRKAGVPGGIPFRESWPVIAVLEPTNSAGINAVLNSVWRDAHRNGGRTVFLKNGTYIIDQPIEMKPSVQLVGESRDGVLLLITITTQTSPQQELSAVSFNSILNSGIVNLTIRGDHGTPRQDRMVFQNLKPEFMVNSVSFLNSYNCWVDDLNIIDSGTHPVSGWNSRNITIRGCYVDGAWNKGEEGRGYFAMMGSYWLVVDNHVRRLRHFGLQKHYCEYNVVYRNFIEQDINFHDDDLGNNLIEGNRIILPTTIPSANWHAVMGAWREGGTNNHKLSRKDNFVFNNKCIEYHNGGIDVFSDSSVVYIGPRRFETSGNPFDTTPTTPRGGTFYPAILEAGSAQ